MTMHYYFYSRQQEGQTKSHAVCGEDTAEQTQSVRVMNRRRRRKKRKVTGTKGAVTWMVEGVTMTELD